MCSRNLLLPKAGRQTKTSLKASTPVTPVRSWSASEWYNELVESDSEIDRNFWNISLLTDLLFYVC